MITDSNGHPGTFPYRPSPGAPAYSGQKVTQANLVLEGGAMRGQFTAGVLDYFMEHGLWANHVIGVSAGALCGYNYIAGDIGRSCYINTKYCSDWRFLSMKSFVRTGSAFGVDFAYHRIPTELDPFDFDAYRNSPLELTTVASNLETGEADYHLLKDPVAELPYLVATAAMPLLSKTVEVDGKKLLDGGTCDSVPILYSILSGAEKHIVVLTQDATYVKQPNKLMALVRQRYSDYPYFADRLQYRHYDYNRTYRQVARLHETGGAFVIRPAKPVAVASMEKDPEKLLGLYEEGRQEAERSWPGLMRYLEK